MENLDVAVRFGKATLMPRANRARRAHLDRGPVKVTVDVHSLPGRAAGARRTHGEWHFLAMARTLLCLRKIAAWPLGANASHSMKTIVISLSLLILLLACGKLPEDPKHPKRPVLPGMSSALPASPFHEGDHGVGNRSNVAQRHSFRSM
jgi:hypothetical protein